MNDFQFASSLISTLAWPVVAIVFVLIFRKQISHLLGNIRSYKGPAGEVSFGDSLADAENSVEAARSAQLDQDKFAPTELGTSPLARESEANPSFVVIRAWEQITSSISDLAAAWAPERDRRKNLFSLSLTRELQKAGLVNDDFVRAVAELGDLRSRVAHGKSNPTPGEAVAYAESAQVLAATAHIMADFVIRNRPETD